MTDLTARPLSHVEAGPVSLWTRLRLEWICLVGVVLASVMRASAFLMDVWRTGVFNDTDDATRMVQVRALMAGQSWFDMTLYRLDPPTGIVMHWSRVVDVPIAVLVWIFNHITTPERGEILARIAFPLILTAIFVFLLSRTGRALAGPENGHVASMTAMVGALFASAIIQFVPGRIDHHAPQIILLTLFFLGLVRSFDATTARSAIVSGASAALSLAISLENLPFIATGTAVVALHWIIRGDRAVCQMAWLAGALLACLPVTFVATVGPLQWMHPVCDAYSSPFLLTGLAGAASLGILARATGSLRVWKARAGVATLLGAGVVAIFVIGFPDCLHDPLGSSDPLIALWLRNIDEGRPLTALIFGDPFRAAAILVPNLFGILAAVTMMRKAEPDQRGPWLLAAALIAIGLAGACWQMRVDTSTSAITLCVGAVFAAHVARRFADADRLSSKLVWGFTLILPFTNLPEALASGFEPDAKPAITASDTTTTCDHPADFAGLRQLPQALLFDPIDAGPHILANTQHSVVAASYHRAKRGNRLVLEAFMSGSDLAERDVRSTGASYLVFCPQIGEMKFDARKAPDGLAAMLMANRVPDWLVPVDVPGPYRVFALRKPAG